MTMNEAKEFLERTKNVNVIYGVPFGEWYVFGFKGKNGEDLLIGGLYMVNKDTKEIGVFNPIDYDVSEYKKSFSADVMYYSKDSFDMPEIAQNS